MITDTWLKSANGKAVETAYERADRDGLSVRVSRKGKIAWQIRYRFAHKPQRLSIGTYPAVSLKEARQRADSLRIELENGRDPAAVIAQQQMTRKTGTGTFEELFMVWYESECKKKRRKPEEVLNSMKLHIFGKYGGWAITEFSTSVWSDIVDGIAEKAPRIAERILLAVKQMYRFLIRRGKIAGQSPVEHLSPSKDFGVVRKSLYRSLSDDELKLVISAINNSRLSQKNRNLVRLLLIYGCRPKEMRIAKKSHFDFEAMTWTIPAENHKMGDKTNQPLIRPITTVSAMAISSAIDDSESDYLFPCRGKDIPVVDTAMLSISGNLSAWIKKHLHTEIAHWTLYDLRKTARTNWSRMTQPHIAELMLGHKLPGSWQVYDHYTYLDEQRDALNKWHEKLLLLGLMDR